MSGFYFMHRGWMDHHLFRGEAFTRAQAWEWMIGEAVWKDTAARIKGQTITLRRGQFSYSIRFMAEAWGWSKSRVERFVNALETETMVTTVNETGQLIITISNYEQYQPIKPEGETTSETVTETAAGQQRDKEEKGNKEINKEKKEREGARADKPPASLPKRASRLTEDFIPPDSWLDFATSKSLTEQEAGQEWAKFRDHHLGKGTLLLDWNAGWRTWVRRAIEYKMQQQQREARMGR